MMQFGAGVSPKVKALYSGYSDLSPYMNPSYRVARQAQLADETAQFNLDAAKQSLGSSKSSRYQDKPGEWVGAGGNSLSSLAQTFLGAWQSEMGATKNIFNTAVQSILDADKSIASGSDMSELSDTYRRVLEDYETFKSEFLPLGRQALSSAQQTLDQRNATLADLREASDYTEGEARAEAIGSVKRRQASEQADRARYLTGLGIDPSSGRFLDFVRGSDQNLALNQVWAGNEAERLAAEQHKADLARLTGLYDPAGETAIAAQINELGKSYNQTAGSLAQSMADIRQQNNALRANTANQLGQLALGYGQTMAAPYGSLGASLMGMTLAQQPNSLTMGTQVQPISLAQSYQQGTSWPTVGSPRRYQTDNILDFSPPSSVG